jgi:hypothetical protein
MILNILIFIQKKHKDVHYISFQLKHAIQYQMNDNKEGLFLDSRVLRVITPLVGMKELKQLLDVFFNHVSMSLIKITDRQNYVAFGHWIQIVAIYKFEQHLHILPTYLFRHAHYLTQSKYSTSLN